MIQRESVCQSSIELRCEPIGSRREWMRTIVCRLLYSLYAENKEQEHFSVIGTFEHRINV